MNEKKYTGNYAKKSTSKEKASKLKSEASARKSYRKKLRYGKKDNTLTVEDARKLRRMKKQGRKKSIRKRWLPIPSETLEIRMKIKMAVQTA